LQTTIAISTVDLLSEHICPRENRRAGLDDSRPDLICWRSEMFSQYPGTKGRLHQADTFAHASGKPKIIWPGDQRFGAPSRLDRG